MNDNHSVCIIEDTKSFYEENITALFTKKSAMLYELLLKINFQK